MSADSYRRGIHFSRDVIPLWQRLLFAAVVVALALFIFYVVGRIA